MDGLTPNAHVASLTPPMHVATRSCFAEAVDTINLDILIFLPNGRICFECEKDSESYRHPYSGLLGSSKRRHGTSTLPLSRHCCRCNHLLCLGGVFRRVWLWWCWQWWVAAAISHLIPFYIGIRPGRRRKWRCRWTISIVSIIDPCCRIRGGRRRRQCGNGGWNY